jgi:UDP-N-acetylglucosamine 2-epimerase (non-hydrolysing)
MRNNTERPITGEEGTNILVGNAGGAILDAARNILQGKAGAGRVPEKWDGRAAERIVDVLLEFGP